MTAAGEGFELVVVNGTPVRVWPSRHGQHVAQVWRDGFPSGVPAAHKDRSVAVAMAVEDAEAWEALRALASRRVGSKPLVMDEEGRML